MMHKACSSIEEVPYCFSRSSVKFQGHTALKIIEFHPNWAFPDCSSSLNSPMGMKCCTKLETAKERCPIVFQGHPSNFKVTRDKNITDFYPNWAFPDYRPVAAFKSLRFALFQKQQPELCWGSLTTYNWIDLIGNSMIIQAVKHPSLSPCNINVINWWIWNLWQKWC